VIGHELAHVIQQRPGAWSGALDDGTDDHEAQARKVAGALAAGATAPSPEPWSRPVGVQRFSTAEHIEIGERAYAQARAATAPPAGGAAPPATRFSDRLKDFTTMRHDPSEIRLTYGRLVAAADDYASLQELEQSTTRHNPVPVLGRVWDAIGDSSHYLDLAARNVDHFHPHNFMAWQRWHRYALAAMGRAYGLSRQAGQAREEARRARQDFGEHEQNARAAILRDEEGGTPSEATESGGGGGAQMELDLMRRSLARYQERLAASSQLEEQADRLGRRAIRINGFGDHFLTDAFAGGHIVTPRDKLLTEFATRLLGLVEVGGVLQCANIPSLAWHDLDNMFGVWVTSMGGQRWKTFGDDYAHCWDMGNCQEHMPTGESLTPTLAHVVAATAVSIGQLWAAAAGQRTGDLTPVLNQVPRPDLDPAVYPAWRAGDWSRQLRFAAGEQVGADYSAMSSRPEPDRGPREEVPNPKGHQVGASVLSARATCLNLTTAFSYDRFVVPMIERLRREQSTRFYTGAPGQIVDSDEEPQAQPAVKGHTVLGSLAGAGAGALIGFLAGGVAGAVIGGLVGLVGGGFIGGLL